jgi:hypothetical protein
VRHAFAENFSRRRELGGACCVYHRDEKVVDLWCGVRNKATEVAVYAAGQASPVLQLTAEGPICMISAPAAKYRIEASYGGVKHSREVAANARPSRVAFGFPEEPWDGIRAFDEEKQQARTQ